MKVGVAAAVGFVKLIIRLIIKPIITGNNKIIITEDGKKYIKLE